MLKFAIILAAVAVCNIQAATFYLYKKPDVTLVPEVMSPDGSGTNAFLPTDPTIMLVHGHDGSYQHKFNTLVLEQLLHADMILEYNIIVVDWEEARQAYTTASGAVPRVANRIKLFFEGLKVTHTDFLVTNVHLVGFDLGAHIVGITARELPIVPLGRIARITGLDPAGSGWGSNSQRLRASDALYVEVIHTDGSGLSANGIGTNIGDVNFHANGGNNQPGCSILNHSCSHNRAYELFAASIFNSRLVGFPCNSMSQMNLNLCRGYELRMGGLELNKVWSKEIYRINTGRTFPF